MNEGLISFSCSAQEAILPALDEFFPSLSAESMLKVCDAFVVAEAKKLSEHRVISNSQRPALVSIGDMDHVYGVCEQRDAMSFDEA